ncbi:putative global regulator [Planctomycetes bacterium MalM25]|nr:putative global regulator [Planctomycetes bacterium MalM25]
MGFPDDGFALVNDWSAVEATGPDAGKFLQSFCTNDVLKLADGESCEAMFTDVKAHVVAYGWVARLAETSYTVVLGSPRAEGLHAHLDRYLIREQVELTVKTLPQVRIAKQAEGVPLEAFGAGVRASWQDHASAVGGSRLTPEAFEEFRFSLRVPLDGRDVDERNLPQEIDRNEQAISFTKGCYLGQEPVARIDALGRVNWLLRTIEIDGPPPERDTPLMLGEKPAGRVTSSIATETGSLALAYVRREQAEAGTELAVSGDRVRVLPKGSAS